MIGLDGKICTQVSLRHLVLCALTTLLLVACSSGGGSRSEPPAPAPPPPPTTQTCADGSVIPVGATCPSPPPTQTCPDGSVILVGATCPPPSSMSGGILNSLIPNEGIGTKDAYFTAGCVPGSTPGGCYTDADGDAANIVGAVDGVIYPDGINLLHLRLEGTGSRQNEPIPLRLGLVPRDLRVAWRDGWTGSDMNILIYDDFGSPEVGVALALSIAPAANLYNFELLPDGDNSQLRRMSDNTGGDQYQDTRIDVIYTNTTSIITWPHSDPTLLLSQRTFMPLVPGELEALQRDALGMKAIQDLTGRSNTYSNIGDAVYVQSAGDNDRPISHPGEFAGLMLTGLEDSITSRLLVVGALDKYAQDGNARLGNPSNYPGDGAVYQANFLVEYRGSPFGGNGSVVLCDAGSTVNCNNRIDRGVGHDTSSSAPRVAGYAALLRHKFPDLSGAETVKILLDTATYEGLDCYPNCDAARYGQGRVDILDALSPIGKLSNRSEPLPPPLPPSPLPPSSPLPPLPPLSPPPPSSPSDPAAVSGSIPNNLIPNAGIGTKDAYFMAGCMPGVTPGGCYTDADDNVVNILDADWLIYPDGINVLHQRLEGPYIHRQDVPVPLYMNVAPQDLRRAWRDGWTGSGVNILINDVFGAPDMDITERGDTHGFVVTASAISIAPAAGYYGLESTFVSSDYNYVPRRMSDNTGGNGEYTDTRFDVVSVSTAPVIGLIDPNNPMNVLSGRTHLPYTPEELAASRRSALNRDRERDLTGRSDTYPNIGDAVFVRSAGNNARAISHPGEFTGLMLTDLDTSITSRLLIVGAVEKDAYNSDAQLTGFSNYPGDDGAVFQENFLVEYGGSPFGGGGSVRLCAVMLTEACNNDLTQNVSTGTSFAAPRVAGFAALVRGKFSDLSGAQTAKILLDTATYEGLVCYPDCNAARYGQGRVDILDALSPIGKLK